MSQRGKGDESVRTAVSGGETGGIGKRSTGGGIGKRSTGGGGGGGKKVPPSGAKRHQKVLVNAIDGITKAAIVRLARRGGVKRLSGNVYNQVRAILKAFMISVLTDVVTYTEHARRRTINGDDVGRALKRQGRTLYSTENK